MQIVREKGEAAGNFAATIGFFDGVHLGHRYLLELVKQGAARRGLSSMVITFPTHPRLALHTDYRPALLTTLKEKLRLIDRAGIKVCTLLDFTSEFAKQSAETFMEILARDFGVRCLIVGHDHRFGSNPQDGFAEYQTYGARFGIELVQADALKTDEFTVSSSFVRRLIAEGDVGKAAFCLGRYYSLSGTVVEGRKVGREIGFPTANLRLESSELLVPKEGVYAAFAEVGEEEFPAMVNVGSRPTLNNGSDISIEAHLLDFSGNLYGAELRLKFVEKLREEKKFDSLDALRSQLCDDACRTKEILSQ